MENVVERVKNGEATWEWKTVTLRSSKLELSGYTLDVNFMKDAMKLKNADGRWIRFMVTAQDQQQIADMVGGIFHSEKTADIRHLAADTMFSPVIQVPPGSGKIVATAKEDDYNLYVDQAIQKASGGHDPGIVSSVGKPWTLTNNMASAQQRYGNQTAYNYGWYDKSAAYMGPGKLKMWQCVINPMANDAHNDKHRDPSQVCEFPARETTLNKPDGTQEAWDLGDIYASPLYCDFVTYGGVLKVRRQLSVPEVTGIIVMPPVDVDLNA